jgi:hypothetical protein
MIDTLAYAIGFIIYAAFCYSTITIYSKKQGFTPFFSLVMIYIYYSILASYLIYVVDHNSSTGIFGVIVQSLIYWVACGILMYHHYNNVIKPQEENLYGDRVEGLIKI